MGTRTFIGIALPLLMRQTLTAATAAMRDASPAWADEEWVAEDNLHVTLKFLGNLPDELADEAARVTVAATSDVAAFTLELDTITPVPRARAATMLWARIGEGSADVTRLAITLDAALVSAGFPAETRPFKPHITLVRARGARRLAFQTLDAGQRLIFDAEARTKRMSVRKVTVYQSTLTPDGPRYAVRHVAALSE